MTEEITQPEPNFYGNSPDLYENPPKETNKIPLGGNVPDPDEPFYESMQGLGFEPVVLEREKMLGQVSPDIDRIPFSEVPHLVGERIVQAVENGHLARTLTHYSAIIDKGFDSFSPDIYAGLKTLFDEGKQAPSKEAQEVWLLKFKSFLGGLRMAKREK